MPVERGRGHRDEGLTDDDRRRIVRLARAAFEARVRRLPAPLPEGDGPFAWPRGAFVTAHRLGELRGCLGRIEADRPLGEVIAQLAAVVADSDPRFEPVRVDELDDVDLEVSVLTPEREISSIAEIEVGRHGLIVEQGRRRGLLLPQVAAERGWDAETFLAHTCQKAGLTADAWRHGARVLVFEADVCDESRGLAR